MSIPTESDWGFQAIRQIDYRRADCLENAGTPDQLVETLKEELKKACQNGDFRVGVDSLGNRFEENRVIVQFKVKRETYDWFFNARTGYRAQFWISPENGTTFNKNLATNLGDTFLKNIPPSIPARRIEVIKTEDSRQDQDAGETVLARQWVRRSLEPKTSKIWICERLINPDSSSLDEIGLPVLSAAEKDLPKLHISRWQDGEAEGLRAPYPDSEYSWLDIKGTFIRENGDPYQIKSPKERVRNLYETGWT